MVESVITTEGLTKFYGRQRGVIDLSVAVERGEVFGYLGPNGAGKTTTIRLLLDFIRPTRGQAKIFGKDVNQSSLEIRRRVGYVPGELAMYDDMTGKDFLTYFAHLRNGVDWKYVEELAKRLGCDLSHPIRSLSHGNKQKIALIQAFMHKPDLLILDEPTIGLDPFMQREFYHMIEEVRAEGRTVFLSSHILPEVERVCDRVGILREGKLVTVEGVKDLKSRAPRHLEIHFARPVPKEAFVGVSGVRDVMMEDGIMHCTVVGSLDAVVKAASAFQVENMITHEPSLEEVFLSFYGQGDKA
jgi:ABC-2 type transport system ATP-binding protein